MRQKWIYKDGEAIPADQYTYERSADFHVMPDIEPFRSTDGAYITGRAAWREHLKRTDSIEMGHSDIARQKEKWDKRKSAYAEKMKGAPQGTITDAPSEIRPMAPSRLQIEMANRLHGRRPPERKELIKLTIDQARRLNRG